ncbi:MAG: MIP/aquaporin family protein [Solirubrobacteraceae bacterium]
MASGVAEGSSTTTTSGGAVLPGARTDYRGGAFRTPRSLAESGRVTLNTLIGETVASFLLIFIGTGSVVMFKIQQGTAVQLLPIALAWAFAVVVIVYAFGHVSGAHVNPSVTLGLALTRKFPWKAVPAYLAAQFVGMMLASVAVLVIFGHPARAHTIALGATLPGKGVTELGVLLVEIVITALLLLVVMATATDERAETPAVGLGVGLMVGGLILCEANIDGTSLNPFRSLAPMILSGYFPAWPAYVIGPLVGACVGALLYEHIIRSGTPPEPEGAVDEHPRGAL